MSARGPGRCPICADVLRMSEAHPERPPECPRHGPVSAPRTLAERLRAIQRGSGILTQQEVEWLDDAAAALERLPDAETLRPMDPMSPRCMDCGLPYADDGFADLFVANDTWDALSPTHGPHGLLCPTCMVRAARRAGLDEIRADFHSGPFCVPARPALPDEETLARALEEQYGGFIRLFVNPAAISPTMWTEDARAVLARLAGGANGD